MRRFYMQELQGGAAIAEGVQFFDGTVAISWLHHWPLGEQQSVYVSMEELCKCMEKCMIQLTIVWQDIR